MLKQRGNHHGATDGLSYPKTFYPSFRGHFTIFLLSRADRHHFFLSHNDYQSNASLSHRLPFFTFFRFGTDYA